MSTQASPRHSAGTRLRAAPTRRKRRGITNHPQGEPNAPERRRCKNDGRVFTPHAKHQEFCCDNCRKTFHKFGGPSWPRIQDEITKEVRRQIAAIRAELAGATREATA